MKNNVKEKIKNNEKVVGTFFEMGSMSEMECLGYSGLDYVIIDAEHGPFDMETIMDLIRAAESKNLSPFVRIGDVTHKEIQRILDVGAQGLIVPCLRTIDEMRKLVDLAKFAPVGNRGFCPGRGSGFGFADWASQGIDKFMETCNEEVMVIPQCETKECLEIIEDIVNIEGIDGIFIGPFDLSISLGIPAQFSNEIFIAATNRILKACQNAGKPIFIFTGNIEDAREYLANGYDGVAYNMDAVVLVNAYREIVNSIKSL